MDQLTNPFAPGAGSQPPELAGRDQILSEASLALSRIKNGRHSKSQCLLGLRGVGKTVLLNRIESLAKREGYETITLEAPEDRSLPQILVPPMRSMLVSLSGIEKAKDLARKALSVLRSFAGAFTVSFGNVVDLGVQYDSGEASSGILESDLPEVFLAVARAAKASDRPVAIFMDEMQYLSEKDLAALLVATHKITQYGLPLIVFGAGLPMIAGLAGNAKSYAERLFSFPGVGPLPKESAEFAIRGPFRGGEAEIEDIALAEILSKTQCYPYFIQEWGYHTWEVAAGGVITLSEVNEATALATQSLDEDFFRVRLDRLTHREKQYMRAMSELGAGPHRSGDIAKVLHIKTTSAGAVRDGLMKKGMIFCPHHGDTAFTVPMFDDFMRRSIPEMSDWRITPGRKRRRSEADE